MTGTSTVMPLPPSPCRERPVIRRLKLRERAAARVPAVKRRREMRRRLRRPETSERDDMSGWNTADARR
jgi:hypothetical protein